MEKDGFYVYRVDFKYKQNQYSGQFYSTARITPETDPIVAQDLADDEIKRILSTIPTKVKGVYPYDIIIKGKFGELRIKN